MLLEVNDGTTTWIRDSYMLLLTSQGPGLNVYLLQIGGAVGEVTVLGVDDVGELY